MNLEDSDDIGSLQVAYFSALRTEREVMHSLCWAEHPKNVGTPLSQAVIELWGDTSEATRQVASHIRTFLTLHGELNEVRRRCALAILDIALAAVSQSVADFRLDVDALIMAPWEEAARLSSGSRATAIRAFRDMLSAQIEAYQEGYQDAASIVTAEEINALRTLLANESTDSIADRQGG
jgi:hypothetical protein